MYDLAPIIFPFLCTGCFIRKVGYVEVDCSEDSFFEVLTNCLGRLRWICRHFVQPLFVHVTPKCGQRILYNAEVLVIGIDVLLRVQQEVGRPHICSHIWHMKLLYLWTCIASGSGCEIIGKLAVTRLCCFLAL